MGQEASRYDGDELAVQEAGLRAATSTVHVKKEQLSTPRKRRWSDASSVAESDIDEKPVIPDRRSTPPRPARVSTPEDEIDEKPGPEQLAASAAAMEIDLEREADERRLRKEEKRRRKEAKRARKEGISNTDNVAVEEPVHEEPAQSAADPVHEKPVKSVTDLPAERQEDAEAAEKRRKKELKRRLKEDKKALARAGSLVETSDALIPEAMVPDHILDIVPTEEVRENVMAEKEDQSAGMHQHLTEVSGRPESLVINGELEALPGDHLHHQASASMLPDETEEDHAQAKRRKREEKRKRKEGGKAHKQEAHKHSQHDVPFLAASTASNPRALVDDTLEAQDPNEKQRAVQNLVQQAEDPGLILKARQESNGFTGPLTEAPNKNECSETIRREQKKSKRSRDESLAQPSISEEPTHKRQKPASPGQGPTAVSEQLDRAPSNYTEAASQLGMSEKLATLARNTTGRYEIPKDSAISTEELVVASGSSARIEDRVTSAPDPALAIGSQDLSEEPFAKPVDVAESSDAAVQKQIGLDGGASAKTEQERRKERNARRRLVYEANKKREKENEKEKEEAETNVKDAKLAAAKAKLNKGKIWERAEKSKATKRELALKEDKRESEARNSRSQSLRSTPMIGRGSKSGTKTPVPLRSGKSSSVLAQNSKTPLALQQSGDLPVAHVQNSKPMSSKQVLPPRDRFVERDKLSHVNVEQHQQDQEPQQISENVVPALAAQEEEVLQSIEMVDHAHIQEAERRESRAHNSFMLSKASRKRSNNTANAADSAHEEEDAVSNGSESPVPDSTRAASEELGEELREEPPQELVRRPECPTTLLDETPATRKARSPSWSIDQYEAILAAASRYLQSIPENTDKSVSMKDLRSLVDVNPTLLQWITQMENAGVKFDRIQFTEMLQAVAPMNEAEVVEVTKSTKPSPNARSTQKRDLVYHYLAEQLLQKSDTGLLPCLQAFLIQQTCQELGNAGRNISQAGTVIASTRDDQSDVVVHKGHADVPEEIPQTHQPDDTDNSQDESEVGSMKSRSSFEQARTRAVVLKHRKRKQNKSETLSSYRKSAPSDIPRSSPSAVPRSEEAPPAVRERDPTSLARNMLEPDMDIVPSIPPPNEDTLTHTSLPQVRDAVVEDADAGASRQPPPALQSGPVLREVFTFSVSKVGVAQEGSRPKFAFHFSGATTQVDQTSLLDSKSEILRALQEALDRLADSASELPLTRNNSTTNKALAGDEHPVQPRSEDGFCPQCHFSTFRHQWKWEKDDNQWLCESCFQRKATAGTSKVQQEDAVPNDGFVGHEIRLGLSRPQQSGDGQAQDKQLQDESAESNNEPSTSLQDEQMHSQQRYNAEAQNSAQNGAVEDAQVQVGRPSSRQLRGESEDFADLNVSLLEPVSSTSTHQSR